MTRKYRFATKAGIVAIVPKGGRYHVIFDGEDLGNYATAQQAADDASRGHTEMTSGGVDLEDLDLPSDISEWERSA